MKWKEMSALHKILTVCYCICIAAFFTLTVLEFANVLPYGFQGANIAFHISFILLGITKRKTEKGFAITYLILGGLSLLLDIVFLLW